MKKIFNLFLLSVICFVLAGCGNDKDKYADFEHYSLSGKDIISYTHIDDNGFQHKYAVADITPASHEIFVYGLFYQVSPDDYILLDKIESSTLKELVNKFYNNKLYVLGHGSISPILEYTLNQEKTSKKEIVYDFYKGFVPTSIKEIKENNIYYSALTNDDSDGHSIIVNLKCSLDSYKCELRE